ncbi:MAG: tetratricopeptide repeat protein [Gammaproteobacteria bacterium]
MTKNLFPTCLKIHNYHSHNGQRLHAVISLSVAISMSSSLPVLAHGDTHERIESLTEQLNQEPSNAQLYLERGVLYREHRNWRAALEDFERAEQLEPERADIELSRGVTLLEAGKPELAKEALDNFLVSNPDHPEALMARARTQARLGNHVAAAADYTRVIALRPTPDAYLERARALVAAGDDHLDEALQSLDEGVSVLGSVVTLDQFAIDLELKRSRYDGALARLDRLAAAADRPEAWLTQRGEILEKAGMIDEARQAFSQALAALENLPPYRRNNRATSALEARARSGLERLHSAG